MVGSQKGKQVQICSYYPPEMADKLKRLAEKTRVPLATYLREAAEDLLKKYEAPAKTSASPDDSVPRYRLDCCIGHLDVAT